MTVPQLLFWRFFQAFGVSCGLAVGAGVIGDIYKLEERGAAMGVFFAVGPHLPLSFCCPHLASEGHTTRTSVGAASRRYDILLRP